MVGRSSALAEARQSPSSTITMSNWFFGWQDFLLRNLGLIADSSLGVVVHSVYVESLIRRRHRPPSVSPASSLQLRQYLEGVIGNTGFGRRQRGMEVQQTHRCSGEGRL